MEWHKSAGQRGQHVQRGQQRALDRWLAKHSALRTTRLNRWLVNDWRRLFQNASTKTLLYLMATGHTVASRSNAPLLNMTVYSLFTHVPSGKTSCDVARVRIARLRGEGHVRLHERTGRSEGHVPAQGMGFISYDTHAKGLPRLQAERQGEMGSARGDGV